MNGIAVDVRIDRYNANRQIGRCHIDLCAFVKQVGKFFASEAGIAFVRRSLAKLDDGSWLTRKIKTIDVEFFQQGRFAFVARISINNKFGEGRVFCLIISKGNTKLDTDGVVEREFANLQHLHPKTPDLVVRPLEYWRDAATGLQLYSSEYYPDHLEVGYEIDGLEGRSGVYLNSSRFASGGRPFSLEEQQPLLEEMVKILAVLYAENNQAVTFYLINAGDFILDYKGSENFSMRLVTARRMVDDLDLPTFICQLTKYHLKLEINRGMNQFCALRVFDEITIRNGLVKAFQYKGLGAKDAGQKADVWMRTYYKAGERGELDAFLSAAEAQYRLAGLQGLPIRSHPRPR